MLNSTVMSNCVDVDLITRLKHGNQTGICSICNYTKNRGSYQICHLLAKPNFGWRPRIWPTLATKMN